jgi:hypothetical protein
MAFSRDETTGWYACKRDRTTGIAGSRPGYSNESVSDEQPAALSHVLRERWQQAVAATF